MFPSTSFISSVVNSFLNPPQQNDYSNMIGAAISGGASLLGSLFSNISANKQLKAQRQENALNRQFNADEAQKNRDFQESMMNTQNAYNDPKEVVKRLMNAGLNPALAFGNLANSATASGGSAASYSGGVNPAMPDWSGIGSAGRAYLDSKLIEAQTRKTNAEAAKTEKETTWVDKLNTLNADNLFADLGIKVETKKLTEAEAKKAYTTIEQIQQSITNLKSENLLTLENIKIATSEAHIQEVAAKYAEEEKNAQIREIISRANLNEKQAAKLQIMLAYEIAESQSRTNLNNSTAHGLDFINLLNDNNLKLFGLDELSSRQIDALKSSFLGLMETFKSSDSNTLDKSLAIVNVLLSSFNSVITPLKGLI